MKRYLGKKGSLDDVRDALGRENLESPDPVSDEEFLDELKSLSLMNFLEIVTTL